jgi:hypothetical protein
LEQRDKEIMVVKAAIKAAVAVAVARVVLEVAGRLMRLMAAQAARAQTQILLGHR